MGSIRNLVREDLNTHILYTSSGMADMYIYDTLKSKCDATVESVFEVTNKKSFDEMSELVNFEPFLSSKWLFVIDYSKIKKYLAQKKGIFESETSEFLIRVSKYSDFKEVKGLVGLCNDIYLSYMKFDDMSYLLGDYKIPSKLFSFVYKSYSSDPEQIFVLLRELKAGFKIDTRKQITELCGVSTGSINSFAISLLGEPPKKGRGEKMVIRNRVNSANELIEVYGYSTFKNFLTSSVKDILDIKTLYLTGAIYDRIIDLPKGYDEKRLSRFRNYLDTIVSIPYQRILRLYLMLKNYGRWSKNIDMVNFVYQYYEKGELV